MYSGRKCLSIDFSTVSVSAYFELPTRVRDHTGLVQCRIPNGWASAVAGDWIVREALDNVYPCGPDAFAIICRDAESALAAPHDHAAHGPQAHAARHAGDARTAPLRRED